MGDVDAGPIPWFSATVPVASVPIRLPWTVPVECPSAGLPLRLIPTGAAMTLPAPATSPPMVALPFDRAIPTGILPTRAVPVAFRPM